MGVERRVLVMKPKPGLGDDSLHCGLGLVAGRRYFGEKPGEPARHVHIAALRIFQRGVISLAVSHDLRR